MPAPIMPFAGGPFDHDETGRDLKTLQKKFEDKKALVALMHEGKPALNAKGELIKVHPKQLMGKHLMDPGPLYLGLMDGAPLFTASVKSAQEVPDAVEFESLRAIGGRMDPVDLAISGRSKSLYDWHQTNRYCPNCAGGTRSDQGGMKRVCDHCNAEHFPRVNPVVIMLVVKGDQCLLGRSAGWPEGFYSTLAGFVSQGETVEEACAREVWEEVGVKTDNVRYLMSQPWPFPSQLMMGMICDAKAKKLTLNKAEVEDAQWYTKDTVRGVLSKTNDAFKCPPRVAIAHHLLRWWVDQ